MNHASLFSGIGGFDLAAREVGWNNVFQCEIDPFCQSVLKYYFPKTVLYEDIKRTDFTSWKGKIDVLTGGFPCQPFSVAGQRKGADDNRYLWPEMLRVIRETRPLWVIGENVAGITNMVQPGSETDVETKGNQDEENYKETILEQEYIINTICDDIEREGYSVQPIIIPACGVGAPHKRYRVWFIASDCSDARVEGLRQGREDKIHGFEFTSQTMDKIRRLITDTSASDHTGSCTIRKMTKSNGAPRTDSLRNMPAVIGMDGDRLNGRVFQLSPLFVEEMMGYPLMWTTLPFLTGNGEKNQ
jgi:DNA (cytosine-5)-methyltransferase 1